MQRQMKNESNDFRSSNRSVAAGFLQWNHCTESLVRLANANANVRSDPKHSAAPKVLLADRMVSVTELRRVDDLVSTETVGKVLKIDESAWQVAFADGVVELGGFRDEFGHRISARALAKECRIFEGDQLSSITAKQADWLSSKREQGMCSAPYWAQNMSNFEVCNLSVAEKCATYSPKWVATSYRKLLKGANATELLAAWLIYIARDAQMSQLQIGWDATEANNCHQDDEASMAGVFARTVPFSTNIDLKETFSRVKDRVEQDCVKLVEHLPCFSELLAEHSTQAGNNSGEEACTKTPWPLAVSVINNRCANASMDTGDMYPHSNVLALQINKGDGSFRWLYDENQISGDEINRISSRLMVLLASAHDVNQAETHVGKLPLLPETERELLLKTWNQTDSTYSTEGFIHQLFEEQVKRDRQSIAVECDGESLTYAELNAQANQLAHHLIARGVKPDDRIAVCGKRNIKTIIALLGILKSGGAYVPLDPIYSSQRLASILKEADPVFLLADATGQKALGDHQVPLIDLDEALPADLPIDNPDRIKLGLTPSHLAYAIYTSGSTGTPKGVMVEHRQVINYLNAMDQRCDFTPRDVWCLFHSFSFDISVSEMGGAWFYGCKLVIVSQEIKQSPTEFYQLVCDQGITALYHTPGAFKAFQMTDEESTQRHKLCWILLGGETPEPVGLRRWFKKQDETYLRLLNIYGLTETTIFSTTWIYDATISENAMLPIGQPLSNVQIYLLDAQGEPVPLGAEGELYIGGAGVARGYLNRPDLTADRFLPDPFSDVPGARMYRTGDRARYLPDGNLVYLGRTDQQLKNRGFRIGPGEIEACLVEHPLVREAVVLPWKKKAESDPRLVAYVVADADNSIAQNLRTHLTYLLPEYMVPAAYVCIPSLPLTKNGKLDHRSLPAPKEDAFARQSYEAPLGEMEEKLATIWSELLGIDRISRNDNFFALGGHSLLIVRMLTKLLQLGLNTGVREVFETPSLAALAETLGKHAIFRAPPNLITTESTTITPEMLPLIDLPQNEINKIIAQILGGVANIQDIYALTALQHGNNVVPSHDG